MAVFSCIRCGFMYEFAVSNSYYRKLALRYDHCRKCDSVSRFRFMSHSGSAGPFPNRPIGHPPPSMATLWWRKQREGKTASAPLDAVCKSCEW